MFTNLIQIRIQKMTHWQDIQEKAFTRWVNHHLKDRGMHIESLKDDLQDGIKLINLVEIISGKKVGPYNKHPRIINQKYENTLIALDFLTKKEGIKLVNISNQDITEGKLKLILGLIWTLILRYQINKINDSGNNSSAKNELLEWVRKKIPEYNIQGFTKDWNDGRAINALVNAMQPGLCPGHNSLDQKNAEKNCGQGIDTAYDKLGVEKLILGDEMANPKVDEMAMMTYISQFRDIAPHQQHPSEKCVAYGPGLTEGLVGQDNQFWVETPGTGKLDIKVLGPKNDAKVTVKPLPNGKYEVLYNPTVPGNYEIHVTYDGKHVPGSIFYVTVLEKESIGGEGKVFVFYSTTTSKNQITRPLQELFEKKRNP